MSLSRCILVSNCQYGNLKANTKRCLRKQSIKPVNFNITTKYTHHCLQQHLTNSILINKIRDARNTSRFLLINYLKLLITKTWQPKMNQEVNRKWIINKMHNPSKPKSDAPPGKLLELIICSCTNITLLDVLFYHIFVLIHKNTIQVKGVLGN